MSSQSGLKKGNLIITQFLSHCQKTGDSEKREVWYLFPWFLLCWVIRGGWHPRLTALLTQCHFLQVTACFLKLLKHAFKDVYSICFQYSVENSAEINNFFPLTRDQRIVGVGPLKRVNWKDRHWDIRKQNDEIEIMKLLIMTRYRARLWGDRLKYGEECVGVKKIWKTMEG